MRAIAKWPSTLLIVGAIALTSGCASEGHRPVFDGGYPEYDCPEHLQGRLSVSIDVRPTEVDAARIKDYAIDTVGIVDRRLMISIAPAGLRPDDGIVWHSLSISSYGGTFVAWSRLQTDQLTLTPAATPVVQKEARTKQARGEVALVSLGAGVVTIERSIREQGDLLGTFALDLSIMPGGVVVDDTVLEISNLWTAYGKAVEPEDVVVELVPVRHPPGLDTVQASVELGYIVHEAKSGDEWYCTAESRATLVDLDSVRQRFWDVGLARKNTERREWLALVGPAVGGVRAVFDSPATANALATWIQTTGSTRIGDYELGIFRQSTARIGRPYGPLEPDAIASLRALTAEDIALLEVGAVGEP